MKMMTKVAALLALGLMTSAVEAQTVDQRHENQQDRIAGGIANGSLTPGEARQVERQQGSIDRQEARMRSRDGGHLTAADRTRLQHRENHASRHIYRAKHNGRRD